MAPNFDLAGKTGLLVPGGAASVVDLLNFPALAGPCTLEWFGRPVAEHSRHVGGSGSLQVYLALLMLGEGASGAFVADNYNGGLYLYEKAFDGHDWRGTAVRWLNSTYLQYDRSEAEGIGKYNLNSGVVQPYNRDVHFMLAHYGDGHWALYRNGRMIKEARQDMAALYSRINGGTGVAKRATLLSGVFNGSTWYYDTGWVYRLAAWTSALTQAQIAARYAETLVGFPPYSGPAPTKEWDFRGGAMPADVATTAAVEPIPASRIDGLVVSSGIGSNDGLLSAKADGGIRVTGRNRYPRVYVQAEAGRQYSVRTLINAGTATANIRLALDASDTTVIFAQAGGGIIDRTDVVTAPASGQLFWSSSSPASPTPWYFDILVGTTVTPV